jgi:ATP-dependent DNA ligase
MMHAACRMGLEGLVSKHRDRAWHWVKIKNPESPAMKRAAEVDFSSR